MLQLLLYLLIYTSLDLSCICNRAQVWDSSRYQWEHWWERNLCSLGEKREEKQRSALIQTDSRTCQVQSAPCEHSVQQTERPRNADARGRESSLHVYEKQGTMFVKWGIRKSTKTLMKQTVTQKMRQYFIQNFTALPLYLIYRFWRIREQKHTQEKLSARLWLFNTMLESNGNANGKIWLYSSFYSKTLPIFLNFHQTFLRLLSSCMNFVYNPEYNWALISLDSRNMEPWWCISFRNRKPGWQHIDVLDWQHILGDVRHTPSQLNKTDNSLVN